MAAPRQPWAALGVLAILGLLPSACAEPHPADVAIRGATVVDVASGSLVPDQTVLIAGNRIVAVGPTDDVRILPETEVIDAAGGYLIPGLWDMHVHSVGKVAADLDADSPANEDWHFPLFLAHGVTGVRDMNDAAADVTLARTNSVKRKLAEGELLGPRLFAAGPLVDGDPPLGTNPVVVRTAAEARAVVDSLADAGADFIKPYENLSREAYFALLNQAQRRGIPVDGHVPFRVTPEEAAAAGQRTAEHPEVMAAACSSAADSVRERFARVFSDYDSLPENERFLVQFRLYRAFYDTRDPAACRSTIEAFRQNGVAVTVDLVAYHHVVHADEILADTTSMRLVPPAIRRNWEERAAGETFQTFQSVLRPIIPLELENVRLLHEAGVTLLAATDVGVPLQIPGISLHRELVRLTEAGLTPLEALQAATLNPTRVLGLADSLGTIGAGTVADLVLLDANPLADISNTRRIHAVVADGRLYRRADLDRLLVGSRAQTDLRSGHFRTSDDVQLHYLEAGSGPTLVFVPGWTMPAEIWEPQLRHFAATHRVVALDPRGHGRSEKPTFGYHPSRRAQDIGELLEHLGGEPAVVAGWSLGVPEAVVYAQEFGTHAIRAFVLVDWDIAGDEPIDPEGLEFIRARVESVLLDRPAFTRAFIESMYATAQPEAYLDRITQAALAMPDNAAALVSANIVLFGPLDLRPALHAVDRPMLFVFSSLDWALAAAEKARRDRPDDRVEVIDGTSHALFVDKPEEFNRLLEDFLASLSE